MAGTARPMRVLIHLRIACSDMQPNQAHLIPYSLFPQQDEMCLTKMHRAKCAAFLRTASLRTGLHHDPFSCLGIPIGIERIWFEGLNANFSHHYPCFIWVVLVYWGLLMCSCDSFVENLWHFWGFSVIHLTDAQEYRHGWISPDFPRLYRVKGD